MIQSTQVDKACSTCKVVKPIAEFYPRKQARCGFSSQCKSCCGVYSQRKAESRWVAKAQQQAKSDADEMENGRVCRCCAERKMLGEFPKDPAKRLGYDTRCKECKKPASRARYVANIERERAASRERQRKLKSERPEEYRARQEKNRNLRNALKRKYRLQAGAVPREQIRAKAQQKILEAERIKAEKSSICDAHVRAFKSKEAARRRSNWKYHNNPSHAVYHRIKRCMHKHLGQSTKSIKWSAVLGYSMQELADHLERQFTDGMSWDNKGEWHIDHIIPASSFDLTDENQLRACMALTNLRPLWGRENIKKGAKRVFLL